MLELFSIAFQATVVIAIPFIVSHIGKMLLYKMVHEEFFQVPILKTLAYLQGILAGLVLIRLELDRSYFDLEQMFLAQGPWDITLSEFLLERANVFVYDTFPMMRLLTEPTNEGLLAILIVVVLPLLIVIMSMRFWEMKEALKALLASASIALWTGWFTVYLVCTVFWTLYLLNFWTLGLTVLYIQYRKSLQGGHH